MTLCFTNHAQPNFIPTVLSKEGLSDFIECIEYKISLSEDRYERMQGIYEPDTEIGEGLRIERAILNKLISDIKSEISDMSKVLYSNTVYEHEVSITGNYNAYTAELNMADNTHRMQVNRTITVAF